MWQELDYKFAQTPGEDNCIMWMDPLHVRCIYELANVCQWDRVMEIGSWDGFSISAIVQHNRDGGQTQIMCVDTVIRNNLIEVLRLNTGIWSVAQCSGIYSLSQVGAKDCCIVDGDHEESNVCGELGLLLMKGWPTIIAHDVGEGRGCAGPRKMRRHLEGLEDWTVLVDEKERPHMATDRGLMIATRLPRVAEAARVIFERAGRE